MQRSLEELVTADSAWPELLDLVSRSPHGAQVVEAPLEARASALLSVQVTTRSILGALAWSCGMIAIDHAWIRLIGAGVGSVAGVHPERLVDPARGRVFDGVVVAQDVLGGRFAIHGGGLDGVSTGEIVYWAPDTLEWSATGLAHSGLVEFLLSDRRDDFYADLRWPGWEADTETVPLDEGLTVYPFLWSAESRSAQVARRPVPMTELLLVAEDTARRAATPSPTAGQSGSTSPDARGGSDRLAGDVHEWCQGQSPPCIGRPMLPSC